MTPRTERLELGGLHAKGGLMLNQVTLSGRIGRIRWVDVNLGLVRIAQNFPDRETEWFNVVLPPALFSAAVGELDVGTEVVFTGRLRSRKRTFGRAKVDLVELLATAFIVGKPGRGAEEGEVKFVTSHRMKRLLKGETGETEKGETAEMG